MKKNLFPVLLLTAAAGAFVFSPAINRIYGLAGWYGIKTDEKTFDFHAYDSAGKDFQLSGLKGKYVYLYFGFLNCAKICPARIGTLLKLQKLIKSEEIRFVYVTIDPGQDTPDRLKSYSENFGENFLFLRSDPENIRKTAREFKIYYEKAENGQWEHTDKTFLLDKEQKVKLIYLGSHLSAEKMSEDFSKLSEND